MCLILAISIYWLSQKLADVGPQRCRAGVLYAGVRHYGDGVHSPRVASAVGQSGVHCTLLCRYLMVLNPTLSTLRVLGFTQWLEISITYERDVRRGEPVTMARRAGEARLVLIPRILMSPGGQTVTEGRWWGRGNLGAAWRDGISHGGMNLIDWLETGWWWYENQGEQRGPMQTARTFEYAL